MSKTKKINMFFLISSCIILLTFASFYYFKTNIIETVVLKINSDTSFDKQKIKVTAFGPMNRSFNVPFKLSENSWTLEGYYLNRVEIDIPKEFISQYQFSLIANDFVIFTSINANSKQIKENYPKIIIKELQPVNFLNKSVFFSKFIYKRILGFIPLLTTLYSPILYILMIIFVCMNVRKNYRR